MNFESRDFNARSKRLNAAGVISTPYRHNENKISLAPITRSLTVDDTKAQWAQKRPKKSANEKASQEFSKLAKDGKPQQSLLKGLPDFFSIPKTEKEKDVKGLAILYKSQLAHEQILKEVATERVLNKIELSTKNIIFDATAGRFGKRSSNLQSNNIFIPKKIEAPWRGHSTFMAPSAQKKLTFQNFKLMCAEPPRTPLQDPDKSNQTTTVATPVEPSKTIITPTWAQEKWKKSNEAPRIIRDWISSEPRAIGHTIPRVPIFTGGGKEGWNGPRPGPPPDEKTLKAYRYDRVALNNVPPSQQQYVQKLEPKGTKSTKTQRQLKEINPSSSANTKNANKPPSRLRPIMLYPKHIPGPKTDNIFVGHYDGSDSESDIEIVKRESRTKTPEKTLPTVSKLNM